MQNWSILKTDDFDLAYIGVIANLQPIPNADFIVSATVFCGKGGKWKGIVKKDDFSLDDKCIVYLPDAVIPESPEMQFMKDSNWRVKMRRFKGAPSEVVIMPVCDLFNQCKVGSDITEFCGVTKFYKPIAPHLQGIAKGPFPDFIPKTDELNYQKYPELVDQLVGLPYYISVKMDGSSTTAFKFRGRFGVCSRNLELVRNKDNGYWKVALKYDLENRLPEGMALQWETCGPGIQGNSSGLKEIDGFAFSAYNIFEDRYLTSFHLINLCNLIKFPMCKILRTDMQFSKEGIENLGEGFYENGNPIDGVVVRSQDSFQCRPISFKVINLNYEK